MPAGERWLRGTVSVLKASVGVVSVLCLGAGCESLLGVDFDPDVQVSASGGAGGTWPDAGAGGGASGGGAAGGNGGAAGEGEGGAVKICTPGALDDSTCPPYGLPEKNGVGVCRASIRTCLPDGTGFGECTQPVLPTAENCGTVDDDDCDGVEELAGGQDNECPCVPGATQSCGEAQLGTCDPGFRTCLSSGLGYEEICVGVVVEIDEDCSTPDDENCNGDEATSGTDSSCVCTPGQVIPCDYSGASAEVGVGICKAGSKTCASDGKGFGAGCTGEVGPVTELVADGTCNDGLDNDCNGAIDNGCECTEEEEQACYSGPAFTRNKGACTDGKQTCAAGGAWGACLGEHLPSLADTCGDQIDDDCDGVVDQGCIVEIVAGDYHTCARLSDGSVWCWGDNNHGQVGAPLSEKVKKTPYAVDLGGAAMGIAAGGAHTCAVLEGGSVKCWGWQYYGQLGNGETVTGTPISKQNERVPATVLVADPGGTTVPLTNAVAIVAGESHSCAVLSDGLMKCWGRNQWGQLGHWDTASYDTAVLVYYFGGAARGVGGFAHTCARLANNTLACWGLNDVGQLGYSTDGPLGDFHYTHQAGTVEANGSLFLEVSTGNRHTCGVVNNGSVKCWGLNSNGQLGNGAETGPNIVPGAVIGITSPAIAVALGAYHSCVLGENGGVQCWGSNGAGQLGDETRSAGLDYATPGIATNLTGAIAISAGAGHTCAALAAGGVRCWGSNTSGQIGDGTLVNRLTPTAVAFPP